MKLSNLLSAAALVVAALPGLAAGQDLKDRLKIHKERLPQPSHRLVVVHPRRLAVNEPGQGRHQVRLLGKKDRHTTRAAVRTVTHKLTAPHKHIGPHKKNVQ